MDGAPACPFVAFADDRDGRSTSPDHRHRCFAETPPAPRAAAHQEAYCLSSAFPVCPTFQDWARREAAHATSGGERPETPPTAIPEDAGAAPPTPPPPADEPPVRRNPPRDWAAPPPWATGASTRPGGSSQEPSAADLLSAKSVEGQGLAGSAADRLAGGPPPAPAAAAAGWSASSAGTPASAADDDLAGLVQPGRSTSAPPPRSGGRPPASGSERRPTVSSTRPQGDAIPGPSWEGVRRYEAYPTIKTRAGLPGLPRVAVLAGAVGIAAIALFMLPALLGIGGGGSASPTPSGSRPGASAPASPTTPPAPTPQVYVVKTGDTMSKIATKFGVTLDELIAANPDIKDANKIAVGDQIIIPTATPDESEPVPSDSAAP